MFSDSFQIFFNQLKAAEQPIFQLLNEFAYWKKKIGDILLCHLLLHPEICKFTVVDSKIFSLGLMWFLIGKRHSSPWVFPEQEGE